MPLSIRIISSPDGESIAQWNQAFPEEGGDIGRAFGSTMQLSDANREISGTHAVIRQTARGYQITDNSTNGLYVNGAAEPLGRGNQVALSDGDVLSVGRYRLLVSCFMPDQAKAQTPSGTANSSPFGDDPFSNEPFNDDFEMPEITPEPEFVISTLDVVDDDPFLVDEPIKNAQVKPFNLEFQMDDDPLDDGFSQAAFPSREVSFDSRGSSFSKAEIQLIEQGFQQRADRALELALGRLLAEMAPESLEAMFNDISGSGLWSGKPKYWDMYKRYFARQMDNRDWQVKFQVYFREAMQLQRSFGGEKQ